jgi:hypothetical protein
VTVSESERDRVRESERDREREKERVFFIDFSNFFQKLLPSNSKYWKLNYNCNLDQHDILYSNPIYISSPYSIQP